MDKTPIPKLGRATEKNDCDAEGHAPNRLADDIPHEYQTDNLLIRLCDDEEFGPESWSPRNPIMHYAAYTRKVEKSRWIAELDIRYDYENKAMEIAFVHINDPGSLGRGYGIEMYSMVPEMALPDGRSPEEAGFVFVSEVHSMAAERVWRGLARRGLAMSVGQASSKIEGIYSYMWHTYDRTDHAGHSAAWQSTSPRY